MSPAEVELEFDAAMARIEDERNRDLTLAWQVNRLWQLAWNGKLPNLSELLGGASAQLKGKTGKQIAATETAAALHVLRARYGGTITYGRPHLAHG